MKKTIALAVLALAACDRGPAVKVKDATPAQVAERMKQSGVADEVRLQAGQWQVVSQLKLLSATGLPPGAADQMKRQVERTSTDMQCLTPEQVKRPNSEIFARNQNSQCKYDRFEMGGGKITALMHCPGAGGAQMTMTMDGTYSPQRYTMDAAMDMRSAAADQAMKMAVHSVGTRVGECPAGSAASGK